MDADLRQYLDAMNQKIEELRAGQEELRAEIGGLKAGQEELRAGQARLTARIEHVDGEVDARTQMLLAEMRRMENRLVEAIRQRREDEDIAFREIDGLKRRVDRLERRVEALEARGG